MSNLSVKELCEKAKRASTDVAKTSEEQRNQALASMANELRAQTAQIVEANKRDMEAGRAAGMTEGLLDRLFLDEGRVEAMAQALESLAALPCPTGKVLDERSIVDGLQLTRVTVPLGVVAMVYEARPNVTADAAGVCLKSGNACVLRGGSSAVNSNLAIGKALKQGAVAAGMPEDAIVMIETTDRAATDELMTMHGIVDVLIPRGGAGLIRRCVEHSKVPVIETGTGNCHTYLHVTADMDMATKILINAKTQRTGVCNACESLLYDKALLIANPEGLTEVLKALSNAGVTLHVCPDTTKLCQASGIPFVPGDETDWGTEYQSMDISVKSVVDYNEAINHINTYGTKHSECIVADEQTEYGSSAIETFLAQVDAAVVYANASTRYSDGGCFGLGAEIGISTQKLHVRGPFALEALTSYKYQIRGNGQTRA